MSIFLGQPALALIDGFCVRELKQVLCQGLSDDGFCCHLAVPDSFHYRGGTVQAVAGNIDILHRSLQCLLVHLGTSSAVQNNAAVLVECARYLFAYSGNYGVGRHFHYLVSLHHAAASACVDISQYHSLTVQDAIFQLHGS